jgi:hypothetical protein
VFDGGDDVTADDTGGVIAVPLDGCADESDAFVVSVMLDRSPFDESTLNADGNASIVVALHFGGEGSQ